LVLTEFVGLLAEIGLSAELETKTNSHDKSKKEKTRFDLSERMLKRKISRIRNYSFVTIFCGFLVSTREKKHKINRIIVLDS